eukprot:SAG31_NODE_1142_length_9696_cov_3.874232_6_plen_98_part_00
MRRQAGVDDAHSQGGANDGALMGEAMKAGVCSVISECGLGFRTQPLEQYVMNHFDGAMNTLKVPRPLVFYRLCSALHATASDQTARFLVITMHSMLA